MLTLAVNTPIVMLTPGRHAEWEASAGPDELLEIASLADSLGYDYLSCPEHVAVPAGLSSPLLGQPRGTTYWDPVATLAFLAAATRRIRLATEVIVLGYHHPLQIAKQYGTLDALSGGRVLLGVGVGTAEEEFRLLGAQFEGRGAIADDAIRALRASLSQREPRYEGTHFAYEGFVVEPHARQPRVPLWIGGASQRALRRAAELGDGWMPGPQSPELIAERLRAHPALPEGFEIAARPSAPMNPSGDPAGTRRTLDRYAEAGVTTMEAWV
ncbi:MAG: TIGR03619 family F420-dependent LLM class oxidoreductase, partial [Microbacterium sp.]